MTFGRRIIVMVLLWVVGLLTMFATGLIDGSELGLYPSIVFIGLFYWGLYGIHLKFKESKQIIELDRQEYKARIAAYHAGGDAAAGSPLPGSRP